MRSAISERERSGDLGFVVRARHGYHGDLSCQPAGFLGAVRKMKAYVSGVRNQAKEEREGYPLWVL